MYKVGTAVLMRLPKRAAVQVAERSRPSFCLFWSGMKPHSSMSRSGLGLASSQLRSSVQSIW